MFQGQQRRRRQVPARRFADDNHRQARKLIGVQQPVCGSEAVLQQAFDWRVDRQPIIHRHHRHIAGADHAQVELVIHLRVTDYPTTAVDIQHHALGLTARAQDAQRDRARVLDFSRWCVF